MFVIYVTYIVVVPSPSKIRIVGRGKGKLWTLPTFVKLKGGGVPYVTINTPPPTSLTCGVYVCDNKISLYLHDFLSSLFLVRSVYTYSLSRLCHVYINYGTTYEIDPWNDNWFVSKKEKRQTFVHLLLEPCQTPQFQYLKDGSMVMWCLHRGRALHCWHGSLHSEC